MDEPLGHPTLIDRAGLVDTNLQSEIAALTEKVSRTGVFALHDDGSALEQTKWLIECELLVEAICKVPDIEALVDADPLDRNELLHESLCHFSIKAGTDMWNLSMGVEEHLASLDPSAVAATSEAGSPYETFVQSMARFRAATDSSEVLGAWLEVWSCVARIVATLLSGISRRQGR